jgi:long-chain acyl-CoA synthetase
VARDLGTAVDPVAAFFEADAAGEPIALRTSGSAAGPRSVLRTTASWRVSFPHVAALAGLDATSRVWVPGPLSATMNLFAAVHARHLGATLTTGPAGATHAHLTPTALWGLLDDGADLHGLTVVVAGDRLDRRLHARASAAGARVAHYYGAAELSFVAWGAHAEDLAPFPGVEVDVRDGEIWVRSPYLCHGYDGRGGGFRTDAAGFATVGDRGSLRGGRLVVTGRPGSVTTAGGTVHLADVEDLLRDTAAGEVVVVGLPDERLGTVLAVALTDAADHEPLRARVRAELEGATRPRLWFHLPAPPRTQAGKTDRAAVAALLSGAGGAVRRLA